MSDKEWFSANDLAGLPGLPKYKRGVNQNAKKLGWKSREIKVRGGTAKGHTISRLTAETQPAQLKR